MSQLKVNSIVDASGGSNAVLYGVASPPNSMGFRNRLINSDMRIDQRNAGASVTAITVSTLVYTLDRWGYLVNSASRISLQQNAGSVTPPAGFTNYLGVTSLGAYTLGSGEQFSIQQNIEGLNVADLGWGTANAQSVTLSFWVRSSLTGTFSVVLKNNAANRSYPAAYTINSANTWEQKTITIAGDTSGTWLTTNGIGIRLYVSVGSGSSINGTSGAWSGSDLYGATGQTSLVATNGATFYITGVQLEAGTVASPFERRDYGRELMMCQRYYEYGSDNNAAFWSGNTVNGVAYYVTVRYMVWKRATPTIAFPAVGSNSGFNTSVSAGAVGPDYFRMELASNSTTNGGYMRASWTASAEL